MDALNTSDSSLGQLSSDDQLSVIDALDNIEALAALITNSAAADIIPVPPEITRVPAMITQQLATVRRVLEDHDLLVEETGSIMHRGRDSGAASAAEGHQGRDFPASYPGRVCPEDM